MCDCKPGTYDNGWHELRGETCLAEERAEFARMMRWFQEHGRSLFRDRE